jgi:predicted ATPase
MNRKTTENMLNIQRRRTRLDLLRCSSLFSTHRKVLKVVRLGEMDSDQTVDSVREAELLANLHNEHIVKVEKHIEQILREIAFRKH